MRGRGWFLILLLTNFALISLESTEQQAVLTLSFECYRFKCFDKILQEGPRDSSLGIACPSVYLSLRHITVHMSKSPRPSPSILQAIINWKVVKAWERG